MRRRSLLFLMAGAVLLSSSATWLAAAQIRSPAEVAARTAPPDLSPILVPVEEKALSTRVVTRGTAHYGSRRKVMLTTSQLKTGQRIVTMLAGPGEQVRAGEILGSVSGRPVFLLEGAIPSFRDLGTGMSGPDIAQLERALRGLGLEPGPVDGIFGSATAEAVAVMYRRAGFAPLVATAATLAQARPTEALLVAGAMAQPGLQVPSDEVVFVPSLPVRVSDLPAPAGSQLGRTLATVTDSDVVIDALLPVEQAGRVHPGTRVVVDEPSLGIDTVGRVSSIAPRAGTDGADSFHVAFGVTVPDPPPALVGASVRLTIPIRSTRTAGLTVPVSAVSLGPDGGSRVEKSVPGGTEFVEIRTGFSADGYVTVVPEEKGSLSAGDHVVVGLRGGRRGGA